VTIDLFTPTNVVSTLGILLKPASGNSPALDSSVDPASSEAKRSRSNAKQNLARSLAAAHTLAAARGTSAEALIARAMTVGDESAYPTKACLHASEIEGYAAGRAFPTAVAQHVVDCVGCLALIEMTKPTEQFERILLETARSVSLPATGGNAIQFLLDRLIRRSEEEERDRVATGGA
jgi:hypothetical protein